MARLAGRVAVVTGAAGGIGSSVARRFAQEGARLCLADQAPLEHLCDELRDRRCEVLAQTLDVRDVGSIQAMTRATLTRFERIDILVNVAGVSSRGAAEHISEAEWDRVMQINLRGVFFCCQAAIAPMRAARYGRIVNIGSIIGKNGGNPRPWIDRREQDHASNAAYGAAKAGVHALTFFLAKELAADGITVNAVAPGPIASAMTATFPESLRGLIPIGRMGEGAEVADAVAYLAGEQAGFVTGEVLDVNGGSWCD